MTEKLLVTGGASGIGRAIAEEGISRGWEVVVVDRQETSIGDSYLADLSDSTETAQVLEEVCAQGPITRLVNNVGAVFPAAIEEQSLEDIDRSMNLNLRSAVQCAQAVLPGMKEQGFGRIVNMTSRAALGKELRTAYAAAKAGLIGLTKVWALELAPYGITVNAIGPGPIATELFLNANPRDSDKTRAIIQGVPVGRLGEPEDISNATGFFLEQKSGFVTGQVLYVCGGLTVGSGSI